MQYHSENGTDVGECSIKVQTGIGNFYKNISHYVSVVTTYVIPLVIIVLSYARILSFLKKKTKSFVGFDRLYQKLSNLLILFSKSKNSTNKKEDNEEAIQLKKVKSNEEKEYKKSSKKKPKSSMLIKSENRRRKVTKMVAIVTLNFAICWLPTHIFIIMRLLFFTNESDLPLNVFTMLSLFKQFAHTLSYLTPVINPLLYGFFNESYKTSITAFLKKIIFCKKWQ